MAEGIMRHKLLKHKSTIEVDSAGTGGWHVGEPPDKRAIATARKNGVDISNLGARKFSVNDFKNFDKIYVMDCQNQREVLLLAPDEMAAKKVELLLNLLHPNSNAEVPDPWFGDEEGFE